MAFSVFNVAFLKTASLFYPFYQLIQITVFSMCLKLSLNFLVWVQKNSDRDEGFKVEWFKAVVFPNVAA